MPNGSKDLMRWLAVALCGGFALCETIFIGHYVVTHLPIDWITLSFTLAFVILSTSPFYTVAYICMRRQYRQLFKVAGVIGAIVVYSWINALLRHWHLLEFRPIEVSEPPLATFGRVSLSLLIALGPLFIAGGIYRFCDLLAGRPPGIPAQLAKAN